MLTKSPFINKEQSSYSLLIKPNIVAALKFKLVNLENKNSNILTHCTYWHANDNIYSNLFLTIIIIIILFYTYYYILLYWYNIIYIDIIESLIYYNLKKKKEIKKLLNTGTIF